MQHDQFPRPLADLWLASVLLTRLPLPRLPPTAFDKGAGAVWAYPLVGVLVAGIGGSLGYALFLSGLAAQLAAGVVLTVGMMLTGAMHEDGLADVADGFWGAFTRERRLEIMKDSQIGTYGVMALILTTGLRWLSLALLLPAGLGPYIACAALSRAGMPLLMRFLPNARECGLSRSVGQPSLATTLIGMLFALGLATALIGLSVFWAVLPMFIVIATLGYVAQRKIMGQTGDVLGACQVVTETALLMTLTLLL